MKVSHLYAIAFIWLFGAAGSAVMKKIQPDSSKLYMIYVILVCAILTVFLIMC